MKVILPVFLALCLGVLPVFSQDVQIPVMETPATESAQSDMEPSGASSALINASPRSDTDMAAAAEPLVFGGDASFSVLSTFGGMGLVLCLLIGAYFGVRKFAPQYFPRMSSEGKNLKIVESISMGERRSIALVEVAGKRFLIGSTPQQINLLTTLPEHFSLLTEADEVKDSVGTHVNNEEGEKQVFRNMFKIGETRSARRNDVIPEEVRLKMQRLREALENR